MQIGNKLLMEYVCSLIESKDFSAPHHCKYVRQFTEVMLEKVMRFCPEYDLTEKKCEMIVIASTMHDIGKMMIMDKVLQKPGRLTDDEFELVKNHTRKGKKIFEHVLDTIEKDDPDRELFECCAEVCMYHHERYDGNGYPEGKKGNEIPISAQIVGLVDAYASLVNDRIYKQAYTKEEAFEKIEEGECGVFSPRLIEIFRMVRMDLEEILEEEN